ncbi:unnamed protein product [Rotaria sp. Silwood1]|nr:unnamed protein product [Rotaria sp. Silwood1]
MKTNMKYSFAQLMKLPDEILMIILNKLNNVEVLYSLIGVNTRFNPFVRDPVFTSQLASMKHNPSTHLTSPLTDIVLDRLCLEILPQICNRIKWFNFETLSMERILLAGNYTNLSQLEIFIMNEKIDIDIFTSKIIQFDYF